MNKKSISCVLPIAGFVGLVSIIAHADDDCYDPLPIPNVCDLADLSNPPPGSDCIVPQTNRSCNHHEIVKGQGKQALGNQTLNLCKYIWGWIDPDTNLCMEGSGPVEEEIISCWEPAGGDCVTTTP